MENGTKIGIAVSCTAFGHIVGVALTCLLARGINKARTSQNMNASLHIDFSKLKLVEISKIMVTSFIHTEPAHWQNLLRGGRIQKTKLLRMPT